MHQKAKKFISERFGPVPQTTQPKWQRPKQLKV
jgi:hypothetical protein